MAMRESEFGAQGAYSSPLFRLRNSTGTPKYILQRLRYGPGQTNLARRSTPFYPIMSDSPNKDAS